MRGGRRQGWNSLDAPSLLRGVSGDLPQTPGGAGQPDAGFRARWPSTQTAWAAVGYQTIHTEVSLNDGQRAASPRSASRSTAAADRFGAPGGATRRSTPAAGAGMASAPRRRGGRGRRGDTG